jgi:hypothetical protein
MHLKMANHLIAAAVAGISLGTIGCNNQPPPQSPSGGAAVEGKHSCKAQNACKGQGGCKTDTHACKGQNACKGQGGCHG